MYIDYRKPGHFVPPFCGIKFPQISFDMGTLESSWNRGIWDTTILNHCRIDHGTRDSAQLIHDRMCVSESQIDVSRNVYSQVHMPGETCIVLLSLVHVC